MNNLFSFATRELSQDAFLCWLINAIEHSESSLAAAGVRLLNAMTGLSKTHPKQYQNIDIYRQHQKIDVLVVFTDENGQHVLIVEDKTFSAEHDNQLKRYTQVIDGEIRKGACVDKKKPSFSPDARKHLCYLKIGDWTDEERFASEKRFDLPEGWSYQGIDSEQLLRILWEDRAAHCLIEMFVEYLSCLQKKKQEIEARIDTMWKEAASSKVIESEYGQLYLARKLFPHRGMREISIPDGKPGFEGPTPFYNFIYSGSSRGTPWTQYCFWGERIRLEDWTPEGKAEPDSKLPLAHFLFWRIDRDKISLRYYSNYPLRGDTCEGSCQEKTKNECFIIAHDIPAGSHPNRTASKEFSLLEMKFSDFDSFAALQASVSDIHHQFVKAFNQNHVNSPAIDI